jgi:hypothetical protein
LGLDRGRRSLLRRRLMGRQLDRERPQSAARQQSSNMYSNHKAVIPSSEFRCWLAERACVSGWLAPTPHQFAA